MGCKKANFHVLRETKCPAVLIGIGFIDNSGDNAEKQVKKLKLAGFGAVIMIYNK